MLMAPQGGGLRVGRRAARAPRRRLHRLLRLRRRPQFRRRPLRRARLSAAEGGHKGLSFSICSIKLQFGLRTQDRVGNFDLSDSSLARVIRSTYETIDYSTLGRTSACACAAWGGTAPRRPSRTTATGARSPGCARTPPSGIDAKDQCKCDPRSRPFAVLKR